MTHAKRRHYRSAFTLLELLLALALTIIVASVLGAALFSAFRAKKTVDSVLEVNRALDFSVDILAQELANALPPTPPTGMTVQFASDPNTSNGNLIGSFEGYADSLSFYASGGESTTDPDFPRFDVHSVQYLLVQDPQNPASQNFVRRGTANVLAPISEQAPDEVIAKNALALTMSYYDGTNWLDTWDSTAQNNQLPLAVEFTLQLAPLRPEGPPQTATRLVPLPCGIAASTDTGGGS